MIAEVVENKAREFLYENGGRLAKPFEPAADLLSNEELEAEGGLQSIAVVVRVIKESDGMLFPAKENALRRYLTQVARNRFQLMPDPLRKKFKREASAQLKQNLEALGLKLG